MIKANELRIGNLIDVDFSLVGLIKAKVISINEDYIWVRDFDNHCHVISPNQKRLDDIKPIPLTPEILEKCGFAYKGDNDWHNNTFEKKDCDYVFSLDSKCFIKYGGYYGHFEEICDYRIGICDGLIFINVKPEQMPNRITKR